MTDFLTSNQTACGDKQAEQQQAWSTPVSAELVRLPNKARKLGCTSHPSAAAERLAGEM